jgi:hypothetical protein
VGQGPGHNEGAVPPVRQIGLDVPPEIPTSVRWALSELARVAGDKGVIIRSGGSPASGGVLRVRHDPAGKSDAFRLERSAEGLVVSGDARGLTYGILELTDRVACGADPGDVILGAEPEESQPHAPLRGIVRYFTNRALDYPWFVDEEFWSGYLTELVTHRFGRFSLAFGLGQDYGHDHGVTDNYLSYVYPFLVDVPGYDVRARGVDAAERERNLGALRRIAREATRRGLRFNLALWAQNYTFPDSPGLTHPIEGLTPQIWPEYSGRALRLLLEQVPEISGLSLRIHYEGGVPDNDRHRFWSAVLSELRQLSRPIELDIHSKGADAPTIEMFLSSGMPLTVCTKFGGEHLTLPYHEASIRHQERRPAKAGGEMALTLGARMFTRYSYGDFMRRDRPYAVTTRVWNGTQRFLLWADPTFALAMGREATFDGTAGLEIFDPLSLRGRWDTAGDAPRTAYRDLTLEPIYDWQKYTLFYRTWGRGQYGGKALADAWARGVTSAFGDHGTALGLAIASASRILPLAMSAHAAGGGNRDYWPELYEDVPFIDGVDHAGKPIRMGTVSPLDPELFYGIAEYVAAEENGSVDARYRPSEVADWFDDCAAAVEDNLPSDLSVLGPSGKRLAIDASIQALLGRFFAAKFRAGLHYERYRLGDDVADICCAADYAESALAHWRALSDIGASVYATDIGFGRPGHLSGSWSTRLPRVGENARALRDLAGNRTSGESKPFLPSRRLGHVPEFKVSSEATYVIGDPLAVSIEAPSASAVALHVRPVDHSAEFVTIPMERRGLAFAATIPVGLTAGGFDLIYFFSLEADGRHWLVPGLGPDLSERPYLLARGASE